MRHSRASCLEPRASTWCVTSQRAEAAWSRWPTSNSRRAWLMAAQLPRFRAIRPHVSRSAGRTRSPAPSACITDGLDWIGAPSGHLLSTGRPTACDRSGRALPPGCSRSTPKGSRERRAPGMSRRRWRKRVPPVSNGDGGWARPWTFERQKPGASWTWSRSGSRVAAGTCPAPSSRTGQRRSSAPRRAPLAFRRRQSAAWRRWRGPPAATCTQLSTSTSARLPSVRRGRSTPNVCATRSSSGSAWSSCNWRRRSTMPSLSARASWGPCTRGSSIGKPSPRHTRGRVKTSLRAPSPSP